MGIRAAEGKAIVRFLPYRRTGTIEIPDRHKPESCEAVVVDDSSDQCVPGDKVVVSTMDGDYWEQDEVRYCTVKSHSLFIRFTEDDKGNIAAMEPLGKRIIATDEQPPESEGGFYVPDQFRKPLNYGTVLALGRREYDFEEGDRVYFEQRKAIQIRIDGQKALLVPEKLIIGFVRKNEQEAA